jgi:hypothetical protein
MTMKLEDLTDDQIDQLKNNTALLSLCDKDIQEIFQDTPNEDLIYYKVNCQYWYPVETDPPNSLYHGTVYRLRPDWEKPKVNNEDDEYYYCAVFASDSLYHYYRPNPENIKSLRDCLVTLANAPAEVGFAGISFEDKPEKYYFYDWSNIAMGGIPKIVRIRKAKK